MRFVTFKNTVGEEVPTQVMSVLAQNQHSTLKAAGEIARSIDTIDKAKACLDLTLSILAKAKDRVSDYGFFQKRFGLKEESLRDIEQVTGWAKKIRETLPRSGALDELTKKKVSVVLVQASKTFRLIDSFALEEYRTSYLDEYFKALADILHYTTTHLIVPALGATWQIWAPIIALGAIILMVRNSSSAVRAEPQVAK